MVTSYLTEMGINAVPHPPYSPDIAPCDFWLFLKLKEGLRGNRYEEIEEMKEAVTMVLDAFTLNDFREPSGSDTSALKQEDPTLNETRVSYFFLNTYKSCLSWQSLKTSGMHLVILPAKTRMWLWNKGMGSYMLGN